MARLAAAGHFFRRGAAGRDAGPSTNPLPHNEQTIGQGQEIFNKTCTVCHGLNGAAGDRGPALGAGRSYNLRTDQQIFDAIQKGIAGTGMPASNLQPMDVWKVVAYIRSLRSTASDGFVPGDVAHGEQVFRNKGACSSCHMIRGQGGILGPDLSNIAAERTLKSIQDSLTKPKPTIPIGYRPVEVTTTDGKRYQGVAKNDNNFSLQLLDNHDHIQLFTSDEIKELNYGKSSFMPSDFDKTLTPAELKDLVAFLSRQVVHKVEGRRRGGESE